MRVFVRVRARWRAHQAFDHLDAALLRSQV
jgi:hypothetical protein